MSEQGCGRLIHAKVERAKRPVLRAHNLRFAARFLLAGWLGSASSHSFAQSAPRGGLPVPGKSHAIRVFEVTDESSVHIPTARAEEAITVAADTDAVGLLDQPAFDSIRWIEPHPGGFGPCVLPTVIHCQPMVTIAVPTDLHWDPSSPGDIGYLKRNEAWQCARVRAVALRKVSGTGAGQIFLARVVRLQARFDSLTAGAYDVHYLTGSDSSLGFEDGVEMVEDYPLPATADRRILVELSFVALVPTPMTHGDKERLRHQNHRQKHVDPRDAVETFANQSPAIHSTWRQDKPVPMPELVLANSSQDSSKENSRPLSTLVARHEDRGWELLAKQSLYAALREFQLAVHLAGDEFADARGTHDHAASTRCLTAGCTWQEVLDGSESVIESLRRRSIDHGRLARELADYLHGRADAAEMVLGLARTFEAISREDRPLIFGAEQMAVVGYLTACKLDARFLEPFNDLGVLYHQLGCRKEAESLLRRVGERPIDPAFAYNLGCVLWDKGATEEAASRWKAALELDPMYVPALVALTRAQLQSDSVALYPEECRNLAERLGRITCAEPTGTRLHVEASRLLARFEVIGRELAWNEGGFHQATILPVTAKDWIPVSEPAGRVHAGPGAGANPGTVRSSPTWDDSFGVGGLMDTDGEPGDPSEQPMPESLSSSDEPRLDGGDSLPLFMHPDDEE